MTNAEQVIEELPRPVPAALVHLEATGSRRRNLPAERELNPSQKKIYVPLSVDKPRPIDDFVENTGLNSGEVLATLFELGMGKIVRQLPGKQFSKVLL